MQIKELQIQIEETETDRKRLERELNALKAREQNGRKYSERLIEAKPDANYVNNDSNDSTVPVDKETNQIQGIQNYLDINFSDKLSLNSGVFP